MNAPVTYHAGFVPVNADTYLEQLTHGLEWKRHGTTPRMEHFASRTDRPYTYGTGEFARTYQPHRPSLFLNQLWQQAEQYVGVVFDVCFLNRYLNQSDHLGWHSDDSPEMDDSRPIAIVSLGVEREIWFRRKPDPEDIVVNGNDLETFGPPKVEKLVLGHGSLCLMAAGMQDTHQHRIPKASRQCGERISLTFRGYAQP